MKCMKVYGPKCEEVAAMSRNRKEEMFIRGIETRLKQPTCNLRSKWISSKVSRIGKNWIEYQLVKRIIFHPKSDFCRILCKGEKYSTILKNRKAIRKKATETRLKNIDKKDQIGQVYMDFRNKKISSEQLIIRMDNINNKV